MTMPSSDPTDHVAASTLTESSAGVDGYRTAVLPDGRNLEYLVDGDPEGFPLVFHHGTPGAAVTDRGLSTAARERGLALVFPSRPGYGESTPHPGRTIADIAPDIGAVLDDLGCDEFITLGWSGGGPHALACAAKLPARCRAAATGAGVAPFHADGLDFFHGMATENVAEFIAALAGREKLEPILEEEAARYCAASTEQVAEAFGGLLSPVDRAFATGEFASRLSESFRRGVTHGVEGWVEDDLAFTSRWGFEVGDITVPVSVWQGNADRIVPFAYGEWLAAHVAGARAHLYNGEGHLSLWSKLTVILDDLLEQAGL